MVLSVVVGIIENERGECLLIERDNETYNGLLALPGGKVELDEHTDEAIEREIQEEAGIQIEVTNFCGTVSEHLFDQDSIENHFEIDVFEGNPINEEIESSSEGDVGWYDIQEHKDKIIDSDLKMLEVVRTSDDYYYNCKMVGEDLEMFDDR